MRVIAEGVRGTFETRPESGALVGDRARLELLRGGRASCAGACGRNAEVTVVVLACSPAHVSGEAIRSALAQTHRVHEVLVAGPAWTPAAHAVFDAVAGSDPRLRLLTVPRPGSAPAAPGWRESVRAAQYLRVALPFATGDWLTVCMDDTSLAPAFVAERLAAIEHGQAELVIASSELAEERAPFADALWAAPLAAFPPGDGAGWDGAAADAAWWARLRAAGVRMVSVESPQ